MKSLLLILIAGFAISSQAETARDVCRSMSFDSNKVKCSKLVSKTSYISDLAAAVCIHMSFDSGKLACLKASANKEYSYDEVSLCESLSFDSQTTACMENSGRPVFNGGDHGNGGRRNQQLIHRIQDLAERALQNQKRGRLGRATRQLRKLVRLTNRL